MSGNAEMKQAFCRQSKTIDAAGNAWTSLIDRIYIEVAHLILLAFDSMLPAGCLTRCMKFKIQFTINGKGENVSK